jgi:hypothetical protein
MSRTDGPQFRKVGNHKMYRHGTGKWETTDNYHFQQGTPPTNLWNVHDLRDPDSWEPVFETQHGDLKSAHAEFRRYHPERESGKPMLDEYSI